MDPSDSRPHQSSVSSGPSIKSGSTRNSRSGARTAPTPLSSPAVAPSSHSTSSASLPVRSAAATSSSVHSAGKVAPHTHGSDSHRVPEAAFFKATSPCSGSGSDTEPPTSSKSQSMLSTSAVFSPSQIVRAHSPVSSLPPRISRTPPRSTFFTSENFSTVCQLPLPRTIQPDRTLLGVALATEAVPEDNIVTSLAFDETGNFLLAGDRGGRCVLFASLASRNGQLTGERYKQSWEGAHEFLAFQAQLDPLCSIEVEARVAAATFLRPLSGSVNTLVANDKTVKLFRIAPQRSFGHSPDEELPFLPGEHSGISFPKRSLDPPLSTAQLKRQWTGGHEFSLHTLSVSADQETFISADEVVINMWHLTGGTERVPLVDIRTPCLDELVATITACACHPQQPSLFVFSTSAGTVCLADRRESLRLKPESSLVFGPSSPVDIQKQPPETILSSVALCSDPPLIAARNPYQVVLWDLRKGTSNWSPFVGGARPLATVPVVNLPYNVMNMISESELVFRRFDVAFASHCRAVVTPTLTGDVAFIDLATAGVSGASSNARGISTSDARIGTPAMTTAHAVRSFLTGRASLGRPDTAAAGKPVWTGEPLSEVRYHTFWYYQVFPRLLCVLSFCISQAKCIAVHPTDPLVATAVGDSVYLVGPDNCAGTS